MYSTVSFLPPILKLSCTMFAARPFCVALRIGQALALWPAVVLHAALAAWCIVCLCAKACGEGAGDAFF